MQFLPRSSSAAYLGAACFLVTLIIVYFHYTGFRSNPEVGTDIEDKKAEESDVAVPLEPITAKHNAVQERVIEKIVYVDRPKESQHLMSKTPPEVSYQSYATRSVGSSGLFHPCYLLSAKFLFYSAHFLGPDSS